MSNFNHNRPQLRCVDNMKREIAEIDSWYRTDRVGCIKPLDAVSNKVIRKKPVVAATYTTGRKRPVTAIDKKVHVLACSILAHVKMYHEVSLGNKLVNTLKGARKTAMVEWFCEFGEITAMDLKTNKLGTKLFFIKHCETKQIEAEAKPYWEFLPAISVKPINFHEELRKIIIAADKCLAKEIPNEKDSINLELLYKLRGLVKTWDNEKQ